MRKIFAATIIAGLAMTGTSALAENTAAQQREKLKAAWEQSQSKQDQGGLFSFLFGSEGTGQDGKAAPASN